MEPDAVSDEALMAQLQAGDAEARATMIQANLRLVVSVARKYVPFVKVGKAVRYRLSELEAFLERQTVAPPDSAARQEDNNCST